MIPTVQTNARAVYNKELIPEDKNALDLMLVEMDRADGFHAFYGYFQRFAAAIDAYEHKGYDVKEYKLHSLEQSKRWKTSSLF